MYNIFWQIKKNLLLYIANFFGRFTFEPYDWKKWLDSPEIILVDVVLEFYWGNTELAIKTTSFYNIKFVLTRTRFLATL